MKVEEVFEAWVPRNTLWAAWAKPVLFAHLLQGEIGEGGVVAATPDLSGVTGADGSGMVILDLPGAEGVAGALELARRGYRPVPLFNAVPSPARWTQVVSVCEMGPIVAALCAGAEELKKIRLAGGAPPVFVLDADRAVGRVLRPMPGMFDNRSMNLPTDFPSGKLLMWHGVKRVVLVQRDSRRPQEDLAHTLVRYQEDGMEIFALSLAERGRVERIVVSRPRMYRRMWQRFLATVGLKRHRLGGFGGLLPMPSSG